MRVPVVGAYFEEGRVGGMEENNNKKDNAILSTKEREKLLEAIKILKNLKSRPFDRPCFEMI